MTLKRKLITIGIITGILVVIYFIGAYFLNKITSKDENKNSNLDTAIDLTGNEYEVKANEIAKNIVNKDYKAIYKEFSWDLKRQTSLEDFSANCYSTLNSIGDFKKYADVLITENEDSVTAKIFIKYSKKGLCVNLFLDLSGKIDGITLDYCTVPEKKEKYTEHYISIGKYSLHGLLTLPNNVEKPPVVILVQDKGALDMDNTLYSNRPFLNIAHGLAKKGIAVVRFNKRYSQYSKLAYNEYTIYEEMLDDVESAIKLVEKDRRIDKNNIYILGHGLGGSMTPYLASNNKNIAGIISLAGSPRHLADIMYDHRMCDIGSSDLSDNDKLAQINKIHSDVTKIKKLKKGGNTLILGQNKTFWYSLNKINSEKLVTNLDIPMLFMQGKEDSEVYEDIDFARWQEILEKNELSTFKEYEDLNHFFINVSDKKKNTSNEYKVKGKVDKTVIKDISKWIKSNAKEKNEN